MTDDEFDVFLQVANDELKVKQAELQRDYALGGMKRWWFDQNTEQLQFFNHDDKPVIVAQVVYIGSFSPKQASWKWGWSNASLLPGLREKSLSLKQLETVTGFDLFGKEAAFSIGEEAMAWALAALAVQQLRAVGCYRAPSPTEGGPITYLAITELARVF